MPLSKKGKKLKGLFIMEYGRKRGTGIFYSYEHLHPELNLIRRRNWGKGKVFKMSELTYSCMEIIKRGNYESI